MTRDEIIGALRSHLNDLDQIQERFKRTRDAIFINQADELPLKRIVTEITDLIRDHIPGSVEHVAAIQNAYISGQLNFYGSPSYSSVEDIRATVAAVITRVERNPRLLAETTNSEASTQERALVNALETLVLRFHAVAVQLRDRHDARSTLDVSDEYDVQDLMHALLRLQFVDVRPEEWAPSYAGSASRTDFLLPEIGTVVETKMTRRGLGAKKIGEQLIVDIAKYRQHPQCRRLICFVYDPQGHIANPAGIERDLLKAGDDKLEIRVYIRPQAQ